MSSFDPSTLSNFPTNAGVYLMKDSKDVVIYVGKAKNLRQRIKQYFVAGGDGRAMIPFLTAKVATVETIVVHSEKEALILESNLIKRFKPRYNALLKDDKSYIALKLTTQHAWPVVELVRYRSIPKKEGTYFGPYTSAHAARETLDLLRKLFPLRQCSDQEFLRRTRPCILYDMKRCVAPCVGRCTKEEYDRLVKEITQFLKGRADDVLKDLERQMEEASEALEYEKAAEILWKIRAVQKTTEKQHVAKVIGEDLDAWGVARQGEDVILSQLIFRSGHLLHVEIFSFSEMAADDPDLLSSFLMQLYNKEVEQPLTILTPFPLDEALEALLTEQRGKRTMVFFPQKGEKVKLIEMAEANAKAAFQREKDERSMRAKILLTMQEKFHLTRFPQRIECIDNSNLGGGEPVSAVITFLEGFKDKKGYRSYKIKAAKAGDDYGAMLEVLTRRYQKAKEANALPDLLIVDGGKGHLNVALKVLKDLDIVSVDVISVVKEEGRHDKGLSGEKVFLPEIKDPIDLPRHSPILFFLQQIRDEAHRFAITFQKKRRSLTTRKSVLDDIPGIGPQKKRVLLAHFGSVKGIQQASAEEINKVPGISSRDAEKISGFFKDAEQA